MPDKKIPVENGELVTVRDAMRRLNQLIEALERSGLEKVVLMRHGKMVAVVLTIEEYERLLGVVGG